MSGQGSKNKIIIIAIISVLFIAAGVFAFALINKLNRRSREIAARSTSAVVTTAATTTATTTTETTTEATTTTTSEETTETTEDERTFEEVADPAVIKEEVDKVKAKDYFKKTYKDFKVEASGNTYVLKYYFKLVYTATQVASIKHSIETGGMKDKMDTFKDSAAKTYGKRPDKILVIYYNGDGSEMFSVEG